MSENVPIIAAKSPAEVELEKGKAIFWCRCGRSNNQPFCDGSHKGTGLTPLKYTPEDSGKATLCRCKATGNAPFCDGTHATLGEDLEPGDPSPQPSSDLPEAKPTPEEPTVARIHALARDGLSKLGPHGEVDAMGVPRKDLPHWDDLQILPAQMARKHREMHRLIRRNGKVTAFDASKIAVVVTPGAPRTEARLTTFMATPAPAVGPRRSPRRRLPRHQPQWPAPRPGADRWPVRRRRTRSRCER